MQQTETPDPMTLIKTVEDTQQVLAAKLEQVIERLDRMVAILDEIRSQN